MWSLWNPQVRASPCLTLRPHSRHLGGWDSQSQGPAHFQHSHRSSPGPFSCGWATLKCALLGGKMVTGCVLQGVGSYGQSFDTLAVPHMHGCCSSWCLWSGHGSAPLAIPPRDPRWPLRFWGMHSGNKGRAGRSASLSCVPSTKYEKLLEAPLSSTSQVSSARTNHRPKKLHFLLARTDLGLNDISSDTGEGQLTMNGSDLSARRGVMASTSRENGQSVGQKLMAVVCGPQTSSSITWGLRNANSLALPQISHVGNWKWGPVLEQVLHRTLRQPGVWDPQPAPILLF